MCMTIISLHTHTEYVKVISNIVTEINGFPKENDIQNDGGFSMHVCGE